jgi:hypothetical protein
MHSNSTLPQTPPGFSQGLGLVPASPLRDGGGFPLAPEGTPSQVILKREASEAGPTCTLDAEPDSLRGFPQFEHGAGI